MSLLEQQSPEPQTASGSVAAPAVPNRAETLSVRQFFSKNALWLILGVFVVLVAIISVLMNGSLSSQDPLAHDNSKSNGSQAVFEVLGQNGVDTHATSTLEDTLELLTQQGAAQTTVMVYDSGLILDRDQYRELFGASGSIVFVQPSFEALSEVLPNVFQAGHIGGDVLDAQCALPAAQHAGTISGDERGYRVNTLSSVSACFPGPDGDAYALLQYQEAGVQVTVLGSTQVLQNEHILTEGNAALALNLLGERAHLIWYIPGLGDVSNAEPTLGDLVPGWLTPLILLSFVVVVAAALWQGRRQGRLVFEKLPVTVPASETMEGRARLYQKAQSLNHSLDYLRMGSLKRIAEGFGLPRTASVDEIVVNISALTGWDRDWLYNVYLNEQVHNEADLMRLSDQLQVNEAEILKRVRP